MNFDLSESTTAILHSVREFVSRDVAPSARDWDEHRHLPDSVLDAAAELGLFATLIPESEGGLGLDLITLASTLALVAQSDGSTAYALACLAGLPAAMLTKHHRGEARAALLSAISSGELRVTHALGALSSYEARCTAARSGSTWRVNGTLTAVPLASRCARCLVIADTPEGAAALLIPLHSRGLAVSESIETLGLRACEHHDLTLDDVTVEEVHCVGVGEVADNLARDALALESLSIAAVAHGLGEGALTAATRYARDRKQFGKPISELQAIQWMLADSRTELDAAGALLRAASLDGGLRSAARARRVGCGASINACHRALQVHGGYGYTREYPIERALRDARTCALESSDEALTDALLARGESTPTASAS